MKKENKKDRSIALKSLESDDSELDAEIVAKSIVSKNTFKEKSGSSLKPQNNERGQFISCLCYIKPNHLGRNCP